MRILLCVPSLENVDCEDGWRCLVSLDECPDFNGASAMLFMSLAWFSFFLFFLSSSFFLLLSGLASNQSSCHWHIVSATNTGTMAHGGTSVAVHVHLRSCASHLSALLHPS